MSVERPTVPPQPRPPMAWASDAFAELLGRLRLRHIALNPGASYRGLHDSLVNYLGNEDPRILVCLHEEHAVSIAHGYAKVAEEPMAVALHSNVGLLHATMALYNAWCDRVPMLVIGATGPLDAAQRRPWIDWIHTAADQAALIRPYIKWDDQPLSVAAGVEALMRADALTRAYPCAPVYVCLDAALQESELDAPAVMPAPERHRPPPPPAPGAAELDAAAEILTAAQHPLILAGRVSRSMAAWDERVELAERLEAAVLTDLKAGAAFPTAHRLHPAAPATFTSPEGIELLRGCDAILALDWIDLGGTLRQAFGDAPPPPRIISASSDFVLHGGWSKDHFALAPVDVALTAHPDAVVSGLLERLREREPAGPRSDWPPPRADREALPAGGAITVSSLAAALREALAERESCLVRAPLGWSGGDWTCAHPLDYLGQDGGAGLASGPGMLVGAALALAGSGRMAVAVLGDGDTLMGATALWSAARYRIPLLAIVANNRTYLNDEIHQERVARARSRPVENRWVGQQLRDPDPDLAALGRSLGLRGIGPVSSPGDLAEALAQAIAAIEAGEAVLLDVHVLAGDYPGASAAGENASQTTTRKAK
ncbi:MAG TPA: thiamine pyrophosphate-binding protein [Solirubrobacteraceae bacterium]|nr:thiamine pyrophosphate-binding protein [Solirubrobacteraceae bacterium]